MCGWRLMINTESVLLHWSHSPSEGSAGSTQAEIHSPMEVGFFCFYFPGCTDFIISHFEVTYLKKLSGQTSWSSFSCLLLLRVKSCFSHSHKLFLVIWFRFFATASPCVTSQHHISCQGVFEHLSVWLMRERWRPQTSVMLSDQHSSW